MLVIAAFFVAWALVAPNHGSGPAKKADALAELRRRLWGDERAETGVDLFERNRIVFIAKPGWEQRLDHRLEDARGIDIGSTAEHPPPGRWSSNGPRSRFSTVRVQVSDDQGGTQLEITRLPGLRMPPLEVRDGTGTLVGTIARDGRYSFSILDASGVRIGAIVRKSRRHAVDYGLLDSAGIEAGSISDFPHLVDRAWATSDHDVRLLVKALRAIQPDEHVLELRAPSSRVFKSLALAAAASVYLAFQRPYQAP